MNTLYDRLSPVVRNLAPSGIRRFFDLASQMQDVISLGVGEPDFVTPWHVREACMYSLEQGYTTYTPNRGLPELCVEIAKYLTKFGLAYDPSHEILVTVGGSEAIDLALRAMVCPGDEVLIPVPTYVSYKPCALLAGADVVELPTYAEDGFRLTADALERAITPRSKVLVLCFPNNPTGAVMDKEDLQAIADVVRRHDLFVVSDEIYAELTYGGQHVSIAAIPGMRERTVVVSGMSKAYAMTGWRIGYAAGPEPIISAMLKIHQYTIMCAPHMAQRAALEALRNGDDERDRMVESYDRRRKLIVAGLNEIGLPCHEPRGAFYAFPDIRPTGLSSEQFAERLLLEQGVAVVPGNVFGDPGEGFVRCSYATSVELIEEALRRMRAFVQNLAYHPVR
ncbi:aminotransferase class I/II-fold pyridoxal phosphate-dependent enzyme [Alicyclobacillus mali]|uniref:Aminotransferase n=1 Tax=Alicyclobacillus mali (ex Roth et al. 2021) TaxID=1123961 RepID=A0ABS0F519_9BACL|nr:aminotransferase class I/II-fold pyridoxal phosphate-dependent enzyme [Alicyclobacillus mali (ex Roth et al. 2021)]MBF8378384.1 aminotransferase class I/II-fold pyridoxal phosphate-dependent enzyme [Alicyclobacillus mali (ex Roth et al. 2021)]MCL6489303.1 aminotransferase class I/II-fold pyridoxal phosphate-dependent enzyme [Alicyclobacillus mali (ex Roth et al. 2021)]